MEEETSTQPEDYEALSILPEEGEVCYIAGQEFDTETLDTLRENPGYLVTMVPDEIIIVKNSDIEVDDEMVLVAISTVEKVPENRAEAKFAVPDETALVAYVDKQSAYTISTSENTATTFDLNDSTQEKQFLEKVKQASEPPKRPGPFEP